MGHWKEFLPTEGDAGRFLRWKEVAHATGLSRTTAWRLQKRDEFPAPYAISPGRVGYREAEIDAWRASRARRSPPCPHAVSTKALTRCEPEDRPPPVSAPRSLSPPLAPRPTPVEAPRRRRRSEHARAIAQQIMLDF